MKKVTYEEISAKFTITARWAGAIEREIVVRYEALAGVVKHCHLLKFVFLGGGMSIVVDGYDYAFHEHGESYAEMVLEVPATATPPNKVAFVSGDPEHNIEVVRFISDGKLEWEEAIKAWEAAENETLEVTGSESFFLECAIAVFYEEAKRGCVFKKLDSIACRASE